MGIAVQCPNGHRLKVKDQFAGKKAVCPHCGAKFRVPAASGEGPPLPTARFVPLDPGIIATLPRAMPLDAAPPAAASPLPAALPVAQAPPPTDWAAVAPPALVPDPVIDPVLHPLIAEQPAAMWSLALPGGQPTEPMTGDVMQQWLDAGQATGAELVWRSDWPDWQPITQVFPELTGFPPG